MSYVKFDENVIGYKKISKGDAEYIVTLLIPRGAMIHSAMLGEQALIGFFYDHDITGCAVDHSAKLIGKHDTSRENEYSNYTKDLLRYPRYKCRAECAEVLEIEDLYTEKTEESVINRTVTNTGLIIETEYTVGERVYPHEFDTESFHSSFEPPVCAGGIHFFPEKWMAEIY